MRLTRLCVSGAGRFAREVTVEGFGPGVNVLAAPNEAGKSTLFRALRTCLFERHKTKSKELDALRTEGASLPLRVTVDFAHDGRDYRIAKSFLRSAGATLTVDGCEIAKDRAADEMLWEILGIEPLNNRSVDQAAFAMLWVGQRESFALPPITKAGEGQIGAAIEAEVGAIAGGETAKSLLAETRAELARYVTEKTGRPAAQGPLGLAIEERSRNREELESCSGRLQLLEEQFARLEQARNEWARLSDPIAATRQDKELAETRAELKCAQDAADKLAAVEAEERRCHAQMETAAAALARLRERAAQIAAQRERETVLSGDIEALEQEEAGLRAQLEELRSQVNALDTAEEQDGARDRLLAKLAEATMKLQHKIELERRARLLEEIAGRRRRVSGEIGLLKIKRKDLDALENIEHELELLEARLKAAASRLSVSVNRASGVSVSINGSAAEDGVTLPVVEPFKVQVGDIASFTITPPDGFGEGQEEERKQHKERRRKLLATAGVGTLDEARQAWARREELATQLKGVEAELAAFGVAAEETESALAGMRDKIARIDAEIGQVLAKSGHESLPSAETIEQERQAIAARHETRRVERRRLAAAGQEMQAALDGVSSGKARMSGELNELRRALAENLAALPDERRAEEIESAELRADAARKAYQRAAAVHAEQRETAPPAEKIEQLVNRTARLEQARDNRKEQLAEQERMISNLEGQIQSAGGDGLGEKVAALKARLEQAEAEVARHERRVAVLRLLAETIEEALQQSRERFHRPVLRHLRPFLNDLFPSAALELDDGFQVSGLKRSREQAEGFTQLSDGTQEQIAVLVRLAMGALLTEQGREVPVILDDALVFSDDDRISRMFDALKRASHKQQIVILTCRMRAFEDIGGQRLQIRESEPAPA